MSKATIIELRDLERVALIPTESALYVDMGDGPYDPEALRRLQRQGHKVSCLLVRAERITDSQVATYAQADEQVIATPAQAPTIDDALQAAEALRNSKISLEVPLENEEQLTVLKILSSLEIQVRLKLSCLQLPGDAARDALYDAMVKPGTRAHVSPFDDIDQGYLNSDFELARYDVRANDHFVDLRDRGLDPATVSWQSPDVDAKRVPFLLERHPCAFCEGLMFCHGYLYAPESYEFCKAFFSEFMVVYNIVENRRRFEGPNASPARRARRGKARRGWDVRGGKSC